MALNGGRGDVVVPDLWGSVTDCGSTWCFKSSWYEWGRGLEAVFDMSTGLGRRDPCSDCLQALLASTRKSFLSNAAHLLVSCASCTSRLFGTLLTFLTLLYSFSQTEPSESLGSSYCMRSLCSACGLLLEG